LKKKLTTLQAKLSMLFIYCYRQEMIYWHLIGGGCGKSKMQLPPQPANHGLHPTRLSPLEIGGHTRL